MIRVRATKQANAERSISIEWREWANSMMALCHGPKLGLHWDECKTTPLSKINFSSSGWILHKFIVSLRIEWMGNFNIYSTCKRIGWQRFPDRRIEWEVLDLLCRVHRIQEFSPPTLWWRLCKMWVARKTDEHDQLELPSNEHLCDGCFHFRSARRTIENSTHKEIKNRNF